MMISFLQFPPVCEYQSAEFTVELLTTEDEDAQPAVTQVYSGDPPPQSFLYRELDRDANYTLKAVVSSFAQNVTKVILFGELETHSSDP